MAAIEPGPDAKSRINLRFCTSKNSLVAFNRLRDSDPKANPWQPNRPVYDTIRSTPALDPTGPSQRP